MRKGRDGEWWNGGEKKKILAEIVATTSLPVDCLTATDYNAAARANIIQVYNGKVFNVQFDFMSFGKILSPAMIWSVM